MEKEMKNFIKALENQQENISDFMNQAVEAHNNTNAKISFNYNILQGLIIMLTEKGILDDGDIRAGMDKWIEKTKK